MDAGPDVALCYVSVASVQIPAATPVRLCTLTIGPGTWEFNGTVSALLMPIGGGTAYYAADFVNASTPAYYGAVTGTYSGIPNTLNMSVLGIGSFTASTSISLRYEAGAPSSLVASAYFDSGPTSMFVAHRISSSTAPLP
jgi:hypothetical protein